MSVHEKACQHLRWIFRVRKAPTAGGKTCQGRGVSQACHRPVTLLRLMMATQIADDEDLGKTILEIEVRSKRGVGYCKSMPGAVRALRAASQPASPVAHLWREHARALRAPPKGDADASPAQGCGELVDCCFPQHRQQTRSAVPDGATEQVSQAHSFGAVFFAET